MTGFYWHIADTDASAGERFVTGAGYEKLVSVMQEWVSLEKQNTPKPFKPSGNIAIYWSTSPLILDQEPSASK